VGKERRPGAETRGRGSGFAPGMAATDHDHIEGFLDPAHGANFYRGMPKAGRCFT
jgi:hypothetical protein